jgi:MinD-like ATPase involved in chromosome partitioning or flagellar assembly
VDEVEQFMNRALGSLPVLAGIPEDPKVQEAEREGIPVVVYEPECEASVVTCHASRERSAG